MRWSKYANLNAIQPPQGPSTSSYFAGRDGNACDRKDKSGSRHTSSSWDWVKKSKSSGHFDDDLCFEFGIRKKLSGEYRDGADVYG